MLLLYVALSQRESTFNTLIEDYWVLFWASRSCNWTWHKEAQLLDFWIKKFNMSDRLESQLLNFWYRRFSSQDGLKLSQIVWEGSSETDNSRASSVTQGGLRFATLTILKGLKKHERLVQMLSFLYQMNATSLGYKMFDSEFLFLKLHCYVFLFKVESEFSALRLVSL